MRQTLSRGMVAAAAATGILSLCGSPVFADSQADGTAAGSPGVASGNTVQVPVHIPVNVCGNTVNVAAALNPAFGNSCANGRPAAQAAPVQQAPSVPVQTPRDSGSSCAPCSSGPGTVQPGVSVSHTPEQGTSQTGQEHPAQPSVPQQQPNTPEIGVPAINSPSTQTHVAPAALAETGSEGLLAASAVSVAMLAGGLILYRRGRTTSHR
ncbi:chaplin [Streptomyces sp. NPDC055722]